MRRGVSKLLHREQASFDHMHHEQVGESCRSGTLRARKGEVNGLENRPLDRRPGGARIGAW